MEEYFAAGCFWHVQWTFDKLDVETEVGYMEGNEKVSANYDNSEDEGYAETVKVTFNPANISYKALLNTFWEEHDPTSENRQGADAGMRYRAVIFYTNDKQKEEAKKSLEEIKRKYAGKKIYTSIEKAGKFYLAEEYHQKYLARNP